MKKSMTILERALLGGMAIMLVLLIVAASAADTERAKAEELRELLTEAEKQKVVVIEQATRKDVVPTDAEIVPPSEVVPGLQRIGSFTLSHYCQCERCCGKSDGVSASGRSVIPYYSVAVDPSVIPLGSIIYLEYGDGVLHEARADDTGGAIKGYKMDLCVGDHQTALNLGIRSATVYAVKEAVK